MRVRPLFISSEEDAFAALEGLLKMRETERLILRLEKWPRFVIRIEGRDFNGSIPTRIMPVLLLLQREINRAYALLRYGEENTRRLTREERDRLELVVQVGRGSSIYETLLDEQLGMIFKSAVDKMTPTQLAIAVITLGIVITSYLGWKAWLQFKLRQHQQEKDAEIRVTELEQQLKLSELEARRLEVVTRATSLVPELQQLLVQSNELREELIGKLKPQDRMGVAPISYDEPAPLEIPGEAAQKLARKPREQTVERKVEDRFFLRWVDFSQDGVVRVELERLNDGYTFRADIPLGVLDDMQMESLKNNSWARKPLLLGLIVREIHGRYTAAKVISVKGLDSTERNRHKE